MKSPTENMKSKIVNSLSYTERMKFFDKNIKEFGLYLNKKRETNKIGLLELANITGIPRSTLHDFLHGKKTSNFVLAMLVAKTISRIESEKTNKTTNKKISKDYEKELQKEFDKEFSHVEK